MANVAAAVLLRAAGGPRRGLGPLAAIGGFCGGAARALASGSAEGAVPSWATARPEAPPGELVGRAQNLLGGRWGAGGSLTAAVPDPLRGGAPSSAPMLEVLEAAATDAPAFAAALRACPGSGLHNPLKRPERYLLYGRVSHAAAAAMKDPEVELYFARLIQRVAPKSLAQALGEVRVTQQFMENFGGDNVRLLARSFAVPGDHPGQQTAGYRWPFGGVALICPFNFPLEIPGLQAMGALYMGNRPTMKVDSKVSIVFEQFLRLLHHCGMPAEDADLIHCSGDVMHALLMEAEPKNTVFTGSRTVAERLARDLSGRVKLEDAGFDWKILGPDVPRTAHERDFVVHQCDQDAYAFSGQKCSAQSILFCHENWLRSGPGGEGPDILGALRRRAEQRRLEDLTVGPVLTLTTEEILGHTQRLLELPGAELLWGGRELEGHSVPSQYGAVEPTAVFLPLETLLASDEAFALATREIFGPFQVVTSYGEGTTDRVLEAIERMDAHLTAAVVSNDALFVQRILAHSVNGTTYAGLRARTTGAPQNHWFGPAGDPRAAGIGTREAIQVTWSGHREIVTDQGPISDQQELVQS